MTASPTNCATRSREGGWEPAVQEDVPLPMAAMPSLRRVWRRGIGTSRRALSWCRHHISVPLVTCEERARVGT